MKKILLFILFAICSKVSFSQSRIGYSESEIREEFWESYYHFVSDYDKNGNYYSAMTTNLATVFYYYNSDKECVMTFIVPNNQGALNTIVELYNKQYVIVSPTKWKMYAKYGVCEIELVYKEEGKYYFKWSI